MDLRASKINVLTSAFAFSLYQLVKNTKIISDFIIIIYYHKFTNIL